MILDIVKLYRDFRIPFQTEGGKHVAKGWVGISCPFCSGNPGHHLGYCIDSSNRYAGAYTCWRCGGKSVFKVISKITNSTESETRSIIQRYLKEEGSITKRRNNKRSERIKECVLPAGCFPLDSHVVKMHRSYLKKRGFNYHKLEESWKIKATGPVGPFKNRIIIPIYFKHQLVSYQGRDVTGKSKMKYKACSKDLEAREHKHCLYGYDKITKNKIIVVEGVTDVWRLGPGSVATFGIKYTLEQVRLLSSFKEAFILFDNDPEAVKQSEKLAADLSSLGVKCEIVRLEEGDPGDLSDYEARTIIKDLLK